MAEADVVVSMAVEIQRQAFREELAAMRADLQQWKQETLSMEVVLPVKIRDDATMELRSLIQRLQMEASGGITIPVGIGGGMAGVGGNMLAAAGQLPSPLIAPNPTDIHYRTVRMGGTSSTDFGSAAYWAGTDVPERGVAGLENRMRSPMSQLGRVSSASAVAGAEGEYIGMTFGAAMSAEMAGYRQNVMTASGVAMSYVQPSLQNVMEGATLESAGQTFYRGQSFGAPMSETMEGFYRPNPYEPVSPFPSMTLDQRLARNQQLLGEGGTAGMLGRNIRGMAAIYIGIKAAEGIYQAVSDRGEMTEESDMQNSSEGAKRMTATLRSEKSAFFGLPYLLRDIGERASGNASTADTIQTLEDSVKAQTLIDRRIVRARRIGVIEREQGFTEAGGTYMEQNLASSARLAESSLEGGAEAYAKIDEEHQKQIDAIHKRAEKLREHGIAESLVTGEMNNLVASADRIAAAQRVIVQRHEANFMDTTRAMEFQGQGDYAGSLSVERGLIEQNIRYSAPDALNAEQRVAAQRAIWSSQSTETAARMDLGTLTRYQSVTGDTYGASLTRAASFLAEQNASSRSDANVMAAARRSALLMVGEGQRTDRLGVQSLYDEAEEADTDNPFERRRIGVHNRYLHDISIDQAHSQVHDVVQQSRLGEINRAEDRATLAMRGGTRESLIRSGDLSLNRAPRPELADAMRTYRETMEELQRYSGDNEHDRDMRVAIRERAAEQARESLQRGVVDEGAYHKLRELAFNQYQSPKGSQGSHVDYPGSGNPEKDLAAAAHDLMLFVDVLKNVKTLYIAK